MNKELIRERFVRAISTYEKQATVQWQVARHMVQLMGKYLPVCAHRRVWEIGCGTGIFTRTYLATNAPCEFLLNDLCPEMEVPLADLLNTRTHFEAYDVECALPTGKFSLIVSCSSLQWLEQPELFLKNCQMLLEKGGCFALSLYGERNLTEIKTVSGTALSYSSLHDWQRMAETIGYHVVYAEETFVSMCFDSPIEVLRHLRQTGVTGIGREQWTKGRLADFTLKYRKLFSTVDGKVTLTYHPLYIILQKQ